MINTFSSDQISKTGDRNADLITRQYNLDKMAKFMEIKSINPKLKQSEIANELRILTPTIRRYRREINMLPPYRTSPTSITNHPRKEKTTNTNLDDGEIISNDIRMTSNDFKTTSNEPVKNNKKRTER